MEGAALVLKLSDVQRQILLLRSRGLLNKEIAVTMNISLHTVETHITAAIKGNAGYNKHSLMAEAVRDQCRQGVWE